MFLLKESGLHLSKSKMTKKWLIPLVLALFYFSVQPSVAQDVKIWIANTNFNNPRNWRGGRLPCPNDRVVFPSSSVLVFMPESYSVSEVVLPLNGELVFPTNAIFNVTGKTETASCSGQDIFFQPSVEFWYNPDNWNLTSDRMFPESHSGRNKAVPHAYQVPCISDQVQFPVQSSFSVQGILPPVKVASLQINGRIYTQMDLDALLGTPTGKFLFHNNPSIQITNSLCTDPKGCICGNEETTIFSTICKFKRPCPKLNCMDPIQVVGYCCPICGAKLTAKYDSNFKMQRFLELHQNLHSNELFEQVDSYTSRISETEVQTVFVDYTKTNYVANKLAQLMDNIYKADLITVKSYGIRSIDFQKSERFQGQSPSPDEQASSSGISPGGVAALVISILVAVGLAAAFYIYRQRQLDGFSFARFDLRSDKIELELGTTPHDELEPGETPPSPPVTAERKDESKGFDNPIYGTNVTSEVSSDTEETPEVRDFVENPMFKLFEDSQ